MMNFLHIYDFKKHTESTDFW